MALEYFDSIAPFKKLEKNMPVNFRIYLYVLVLYDYMKLYDIFLLHWFLYHPGEHKHTTPQCWERAETSRHCNCINSCNSSRHLSNDSDDEDADICSGKHSTVLPLAGPEKIWKNAPCSMEKQVGTRMNKVSRITRYYKILQVSTSLESMVSTCLIKHNGAVV